MFKKNNNRFLIKTPTGFESFEGIQKKFVDSLYTFIFDDETFIKCSGKHLLLTEEGFKTAEKITYENTLTNKKIKEIVSEFGVFEVFDPVGIKKHASYYSNDVISHNTEFLGSTNTLVSGEKLATLAYKEQIGKYSDMVIYEEPIKYAIDDDTGAPISNDHLYVICVDVSEGKNLDYSAFSVFDVSSMPYKQVAIYRNNNIPPMLFPSVIKACAEYYNDAHVLVEININPQIADILCEDLGYENVLRVFTGNKKPQVLSMKGGRGVAQGLKMTPLVKRIGCSTLKTIIENDKLIIQDFETISELTTFVVNGPTFAAEEGCNDDLAMTLVIFSWMTTQRMFKDIVAHDLRKQLQIEHFDFADEEMLPVIAPTNGLEGNYFVEDDSVWVATSAKDPYQEIFDHYFRDNDSRESRQNEFF